MQLSRRAQRLAESATMRVSRRAAEFKAAGRDLVDLSAGQPDFPSPPVAVEAACRALADGFTRYTAAAGTPELRAAVAQRYARDFGAPWEAPDALITVGAKAALFQLAMTLWDAGDEVVLPTPTWVSFVEQIRFAGATPVEVPMEGADGFTLRAAPILDALTDKTRAVLLNAPCNPTGGTIDAGELRALVEACAARGVTVLSDETYERFVYDGEPVSCASLAREFPETVVVVGSFSKTYSMTGWRVGYALGPREVIAKTASVQSHATSNPTSFAMSGALAALVGGDGTGAEADVRRMLEEFGRRRELVVRRLAEIPGVECPMPRGAFYVFPRVDALYRDGRRGSLDFTEWLLEEAGVALVPGLAFGADEHIRLSFTYSMASLEEGLDRLAAVLAG